MGAGFGRAFVRPTFFFLLVALVVALLIVGIGQLLLALHPELIHGGGEGVRETI